MMNFRAFLLASVLGFIAGSAMASPVTLTVTGNIDEIWDTYGDVPTSGSINVGDALKLTYTYDPASMTAENYLAGIGEEAYSAPAIYDLMVGGVSIAGAGIGTAYIGYEVTYGGSVQPFNLIGFASPEIQVSQSTLPFAFPSDGPYFEEFNFDLTQSPATTLSSFAFPQIFNPASYNYKSIDIDFNSSDDGVIARADNLDITVNAVSAAPEPSRWILMMCGIGAIGQMLRVVRRSMALRLSDVFAG